MTIELGASGELAELAKAIGLLDASGNLDVTWFSQPLTRLEGAVREPAQRQALLAFLDLVLPPQPQPGRPAAEKWHPLLGAQPGGNLYLTMRDTGSAVVIGVGGEFHSGAGAAVPGRLLVHSDIISAGASLDLVVGTHSSPIVVEARVETGWGYDPAHGRPVGLQAIAGTFEIVPDPQHPSAALHLLLEQLSLGGEPPADKALDATDLGHDVPDVLAGLLKVVLAEAGADPTVTMLSDHLLALLGLADADAIPAFPFAQLGDGPSALQQWLAQLLGADGSAGAVTAWLTHFAGLLGQAGPVQGSGALSDPWRAPVFSFGVGEVSATLARSDGHLRVGVAVFLDAALGTGEPHVGVQAQIAIADIPLGGTAHARVLPDAAALVRITGDGQPLVADPAVTVGSVQAGVRWDGSRLAPAIELLDSSFGGTPYPRLDLTNAESVEAAAAGLVVTAIDQALGTGTGHRIGAIAGLVPPEDPAAPGNPVAPWPHQLDLARLVADPARAIGAYHLSVLGDGDRWSLLLGEIARLVGCTDPVGGAGTQAQPWTVPIGGGGPQLELAAWHGPAPDVPATQQLRIGLRLAAGAAGATFAWTSEILGFDLPAAAAGAVRLVGQQEIRLALSPALDSAAGPVALRLDEVELVAGWAPGQPLGIQAHARGFTIEADGDSLTIADLHLPPPGGFDLANLDASAAALGLSVTDLEQVLRLLLSLFAAHAGPGEQVAAALLGLHRQLAGLSEDTPVIVDPVQPGLLLRDPLRALRDWIARLLPHVGTAGQASAAELLRWLAALGSGQAADLGAELPPDLLDGAGTFARPWRLPWPGAAVSGPDLEVWLDPDGPPSAWVSGLAVRAQAATGYDELAAIVTELSWHDPALASLVSGLSARGLTQRLRGLETYLNSGDGVVPRDSQDPDIFGWVNDVEVDAAHHLAASHPDAITDILTKIEAIRAGAERVVLLVGPAFADATAWASLLASGQRQGQADPGAHFDLRAPGTDPATISLDAVTAVADYYTADLADDGGGDASFMAGQIAHIADRLEALHPGKIIIVAHSYAGLAARRFAADHPDRTQGLITVATPHVGSPLSFLHDPELGDAVRIAGVLRPAMAASVVRDALDHLTAAVEGCRPPAATGALATPDPYPAASFGMAAPFDVGDVPVVTLGAVITDDVFEWWRAALIAHIGQVAGVARAAPTHLAYGMAMPLPLGSGVFGTPDADARVRFALGRIPLGDAVPEPARPAQLLRVELDLFDADGWLVGGPASGDADGRLRRLQLGVTAQHGSAGVQAAVDGTLSQAAWRGVTAAQADLTDPRAAALAGAAFSAVLASTDSADVIVSGLAAALSGLDLLATDARGATGLSSDGFAALRTDPVGYLRARIPAALARPGGWAGLTADESLAGAYRWVPPGSPYTLVVSQGSVGTWRAGIETAAAQPVSAVNLGLGVDIALPDFQSAVDVFLNIGIASVHYRAPSGTAPDGTVAVDARPWLEDVVLWPTPPLADLAARLGDAWPGVLVSGVLSSVVAQFAPGLRIQALEQLIRSPGEFLAGAAGLGRDGGGLDAAKLAELLAVMNTAIGLPAGPGLQLPAGLSVVAGPGSAPDAARIGVTSTQPIGGVLSLGVTIDIDALRHITPGGTVTVAAPLAGTWPAVAITFGAGPSGVTLAVTPQGITPITLLPAFGGLGALAGAAAALLPSVLDAAVTTFPVPRPAWLQHLLDAAGHLGLYDSAGGFSAHAAGFTALLHGTAGSSLDDAGRARAAAAVTGLLTLIPGLPGTLSSTGGLVQWTAELPAGQGSVELGAGWGASGTTLHLSVHDLRPTSAPLALSAAATVDGTGVEVSLSLGADLSSLGIQPVPTLTAALDTADPSRFVVRLAPLASPGGDGPLVIRLAPDFGVDTGPGTAGQILTGWALPLGVQTAVQAAAPMLPRPLWTGGPTLQEALTDAGILTAGTVARPLPGVLDMLTGFLVAAAGQLDLHVGHLHLRLADENGRIGLGLSGQQDIPLGDLQLSVVFGAPAAWGAAAAEGLLLLLLDTGGPGVAFHFGAELHGVGVALSKADGTALVAETYLRLGSVLAVLFMDIETVPGLHVQHAGAGLRLGGFGLPISSALGAGGGSNPVASNILGSGGPGPSGDAHGVSPATDVDAWYWDDPANAGGPLRVLIGGQTGVFWIPIQAAFGPVFINELGLGVTSSAASMVIDGGVSIAGLSAEVDGLSVTVPYAHVTDPSRWTIDLKGLAIGYSGPSIDIAGGLVKYDGPPVEYDGMLLIKIASVGAIVIGSYSVVGSGPDAYTSLAIFGGIFVPIGLPPVINLTGLALGLGYNRRLIVPEDLSQIPGFMLVQALDRPEALANNPMQALFAFRQQVPPSRGALWLAAGLRGTSFEVVNITAVLYVSVGAGAEVGLLGIARMALPSDDTAIASIELALKARFSAPEGLFSEQAQLTDNSWLISRDCQLTGGYAFFMWFPKAQFLLTLGGYHPSFKPLPEYPVVPRLGFRWSYLGVVHIKGEAYFALTNTAVMAGARFDAAYGPDWLQVWFTAYADILIARDPFHYEADVGVSVGARLHIEVCFFACCTMDISVSVGASLQLSGPPFHGTVTADLGVTSVTVPFGDDAQPLPPPRHWDEFVAVYVKSSDPAAGPVGAQVTAGLLPAEPAGGPVAPGTLEQPWRLSAEWSLRTESRMPARGFMLQADIARSEADIPVAVFGSYENLSATYEFDLAPMYVHASDLRSRHRLVLSRRPAGGGGFADLIPRGSPGDPALIIDERLFAVRPVIGQVSEATYHFFPDLKPPAAANTLPALLGLALDGIAGLHNPSAPVPIGTLVDATNYRPLPFARRTPAVIGDVQAAGTAWVTLAGLAVGAPAPALLGAVSVIVGGGAAEFVTLREDSGLRPSGYGRVALHALTSRRTSAPVLSALSEGYTLDDPGNGTPPVVTPVGPVTGVPLAQPRLRSVMQRPVRPAGAPPVVPTSVRLAPPVVPSPGVPPPAVSPPGVSPAGVSPAGAASGPPASTAEAPASVGPPPGPIPVVDVRSDLITTWDAPGFALLTQATDVAARPTRAARSARTLRHPALGGPVGRSAAAAIESMSKAVAGDGVSLRAGCTHLWELPGRSSWQLALTGTSAVRVTELTSAATVLRDREFDAGQRLVDLVGGCAMVAVTALGVPGAAGPAGSGAAVGGAADGGPAAVASAAAPRGTIPVLGWQLDGAAVQVGPTTLLVRGAVLSLSKPAGLRVRGHLAATGVIPLSRAMLDQEVVRTVFPAATGVAGVLVDRPDPGALASDAVLIRTDHRPVTGLPVQVAAGNRTLFLYDLAPSPDRAADTVGVTVGLRAGLAMAGVVGAPGTAAAWAATLAGSTLHQLVPDEHLTPEGELRVRLVPSEVSNG